MLNKATTKDNNNQNNFDQPITLKFVKENSKHSGYFMEYPIHFFFSPTMLDRKVDFLQQQKAHNVVPKGLSVLSY